MLHESGGHSDEWLQDIGKVRVKRGHSSPLAESLQGIRQFEEWAAEGGGGGGAGLHFSMLMAGLRWGTGAGGHFSLGLESSLI